MKTGITVTDIEVSRPLADIHLPEGHRRLYGLVRVHGSPVGTIEIPDEGGIVYASAIADAIVARHSKTIVRRLLRNALEQDLSGSSPPFRISALVAEPRTQWNSARPFPTVTVAVCTRNRPDELDKCLESLGRIEYPRLEILVVDNAPSTDPVRASGSPDGRVRHLVEPRPGLNWARNRAILEARGEIIAFTDDDCVVDTNWVRALASVFSGDPDAVALTGLVVPLQLETRAQILFERYLGFGRGFERQWYDASPFSGAIARRLGNTGRLGTGANMAFRRSVFDTVGFFDPALDAGTLSGGAGDLEMFFRILKNGGSLIYEPDAVVRHRHRRSYDELRSQLFAWGTGMSAYVERSASTYPEERVAFTRLQIWLLFSWHLRRLVSSALTRGFPPELVMDEMRGVAIGRGRYRMAVEEAREISSRFERPAYETSRASRRAEAPSQAGHRGAVATRRLDLRRSLASLRDVAAYSAVRVFVTLGSRMLGSVYIENRFRPLSVARLAGAISNHLPNALLETPDGKGSGSSASFLRDLLVPPRSGHAIGRQVSMTQPEKGVYS